MEQKEMPLNLEQLRDAIRDSRPGGLRPSHSTIIKLIAQGLPWHEDRSYPTGRKVFYWSEIEPWIKGGLRSENQIELGRRMAMALKS